MLTYDVNSPLVDDYLAVFPDVTREAAAGSLIDIAQTLAQNEKPTFNPNPEIQGKLEIIYGKIVEEIEQERKNNLEEAGESDESSEKIDGVGVENNDEDDLEEEMDESEEDESELAD